MTRAGIGIDISDEHVRIAYVNRRGIPKGVYELKLPKGFVVDDQVEKAADILKHLTKLFSKAGLDEDRIPATILVPESRVFTSSFVVPPEVRARDVEDEAIAEAQRNIPIPFRDAIVEVVAGLRAKEGTRVTVFAAQQDLLEGLANAFSHESLSIISAESNNLAIVRLFKHFGRRDLQLRSMNDLLFIVDIGSVWSNITVYDKINTAVLSRSVENPSPTVLAGTLGELKEYFEGTGFKIPSVLLAGADGADSKIDKACKKALSKTDVYHIGEVIEMGVDQEKIHTFGAAIGAGIRAASPKQFLKDHNFIRD